MAITKKKPVASKSKLKISDKAAKSKASTKSTKSTKKSSKATPATKSTSKKSSSRKMPATAKKVSKPNKTKKPNVKKQDHHSEDFHAITMDDAAFFTLSTPDQPIDYDIVCAKSRTELIALVKSKLYIHHDGSAWVPQGAAFEEDDQWYQTFVKYE